MHIEFRHAEATDTPVLAQMLRNGKEIKQAHGDTAWDGRDFGNEAQAAAMVASGNTYVATIDDTPALTVTLTEEDPRMWGAQGTDGTALYVHKLTRLSGDKLKGLGAEGLRFAEELARSLGKLSVRLDNPEELDAFYEDHGYRAVGAVDMGVYQPALREKILSDRS